PRPPDDRPRPAARWRHGAGAGDALLDPATARSVIELACRAPSLHNTQPWRWRIGPSSLHLFADPDRRLDASDPYDHDLVVACGAALHHLQVALRAAGWQPLVHRIPDPARPDHLAAVEMHPREPSQEDLALASAIERRRTDRRAFTSWPVPDQLREGFCRLAEDAGAELLPLDAPGERWRIAQFAEAAAVAQALTPGVVAETHSWSGRRRGAQDGVPAGNVSDPGRGDDAPTFPLQNVAGAELPAPLTTDPDDGTWLALLVTREDGRLARLRAGEALSSVLLEATVVGMAAQPVTQLLQVPELRARVRDEVTGGLVPHVLLRLGWASSSAPPVPPTGRRGLADVLEPWDAPWPDPATAEP
ncbi:Nitroreductase-like, partial [Klenkia terrae]